MASRPDPVTRAANHASPGVPRQIRARTGETSDPVPEGFHPANPQHHFHVTPADHDGDRAMPKFPQEMGVSETQELAHQNAVHEMHMQEQRAQHEERLHQRQHDMPIPVNKATWAGETTAGNKQMDSRSGPRPAKWGNHHRQ